MKPHGHNVYTAYGPHSTLTPSRTAHRYSLWTGAQAAGGGKDPASWASALLQPVSAPRHQTRGHPSVRPLGRGAAGARLGTAARFHATFRAQREETTHSSPFLACEIGRRWGRTDHSHRGPSQAPHSFSRGSAPNSETERVTAKTK